MTSEIIVALLSFDLHSTMQRLKPVTILLIKLDEYDLHSTMQRLKLSENSITFISL